METEAEKDASSSIDDTSSEYDSSSEDEKESLSELEDDVVIQAIMNAKSKATGGKNKQIKVPTMPSSLAFSPNSNLIVISTLAGTFHAYNYFPKEDPKEVSTFDLFTEAADKEFCRECLFSPDGLSFMASLNSGNMNFYDVQSEFKITQSIPSFTNYPANCMTGMDENCVAVGDDYGHVTIYDKRTVGPSVSLEVSDESINSILCDDKKQLICALAQGGIGTLKYRKPKINYLVRSEMYDSQFNCIASFRHNTKIAVGDDLGHMYFFNKNQYGYHSDMYKGAKKESFNTLIPITEKIGIVGTDEGYVRAYSFFPHFTIGIIGRHDGPVQKMDICDDGHLLATSSDDEIVRLWNVDYFKHLVLPKVVKKKNGTNGQVNLPSSNQQNTSDFFKDLN